MNKMITPRLIPALIAVAFSSTASAAGFQLLEQNASGLGNAYAGSAANAENASTIYYNPAGMTQLKGTSVSVGVNAIRPSFTFSNDGSTNPVPMGPTVTGGNGGDAGGKWAPLPNGYIAYQIDDKWHVGVGLGAPFGLATEYDDNWVGRYHSIKFDIKTYNINPSVAYKVNDVLSVGFGLNWQRIEAEYIKQQVVAAMTSVQVTNKLDGDAWGWNVGATIQPSPDTRIGVSYRSSIKHKASGDQKFSAIVSDTWAKAEVDLPDTFILSGLHHLNDRWDLLGDVSWTGWSSIPKLVIEGGHGSSGLNLQFRDAWRVAVGANYKVNEIWKLKMGLAYDESPVYEEKNRPASLPDNDRTWFSLGVQYAPSKTSTIDVGYSYLMVGSSQVANADGAATRGVLSGSYDAHAHILGMQYSANF